MSFPYKSTATKLLSHYKLNATQYWSSITGTTKSVTLTLIYKNVNVILRMNKKKTATPAGGSKRKCRTNNGETWSVRYCNEWYDIFEWTYEYRNTFIHIKYTNESVTHINMNRFQLSYSLSTNKKEKEKETKKKRELKSFDAR